MTSKSGIIYSDDHGITWTYAQGPNTSSAAMSETQIVEMPDGSLKVYARSNNSKIASAASIALSNGCEVIYYGAHSDDAAGNAYPDCSDAFNDAMNRAESRQ